jgi:hypothetical protein
MAASSGRLGEVESVAGVAGQYRPELLEPPEELEVHRVRHALAAHGTAGQHASALVDVRETVTDDDVWVTQRANTAVFLARAWWEDGQFWARITYQVDIHAEPAAETRIVTVYASGVKRSRLVRYEYSIAPPSK